MKVQQIPGLRAWIGCHWRGELDSFRTLLVSPLLILAPAMLISSVGLLWAIVHPYSSVADDIIIPVAGLAYLAGLGWWTGGVHQKGLVLLGQGQLMGAFFTLLLSAGGALLLITHGYEWLTEPRTTLSDEAREWAVCKKSQDDWARAPWLVVMVPELNRIVAIGDIGEGSAQALQDALDRHPEVRLIELDSLGGLVKEEWKISQLVEQRGLDTLVQGRCASACTFVFLAGARRYISPQARLGFHRSGFCGQEANAPWDTTEHMSYIEFRQKGVREDFVQKALGTAHEKLWRPSAQEAKAAGFATDWWHLIAHNTQ